MKKSTKIIIAIAMSVGVASGAAAFGKRHHGDPAKHVERVAGYVAYQLELDDTQKQSLDVLKNQLLETHQAMHGENMMDREQALSMLTAESFDRNKMLEMITTKTVTVNEQAPDIVEAFGDFIDGLNVEQKNEIAEFMQEHRGGRKGW